MQSLPRADLLGLLVFVLVISVISLSSLHWQQIGLQSGSRLIDQPQTWIMISKCLLDFTLVVLIILAITRCINSGVWLWPAIDILLRTSSTCVTLSELLFSRQNAWSSRAYAWGWWWRESSPLAFVLLTLLKLLPMIKPQEVEWHFWTVTGANFLESSVFGCFYWWHFAHLRECRKWGSFILLGSSILWFIAIIVAMTPFILWRDRLSRGHLLLTSFVLCQTLQFSQRLISYARTQAETRKRSPHGASSESVQSLTPETISGSEEPTVQESIADHPSVSLQVDNAEDVRRVWKILKEQRRKVMREKQQKETVSSVQTTWCCKCYCLTESSTLDWCVEKFCQHNRCWRCREKGGASSSWSSCV